jgi:hypothetical protein
MFDPHNDLAIVVLYNSDRRAFAQNLRDRVYERMLGKPAVSIAPK